MPATVSAAPLLVTGFEAYAGWTQNPAGEVARRLDGEHLGGVVIVGRLLPVVLEGLRERVEALLDTYRPRAVLSLGLNPAATTLRIERVAINCADFLSPDNAGAQPRGAALVAGGTAAHFATLPVHDIVAAQRAAGIPALLSNSAGTYLCNATLYTFLDTVAHTRLSCPCGFMHVPLSPAQVAESLHARGDAASGGAGVAGSASMAPDLVAEGARVALRATLARL